MKQTAVEWLMSEVWIRLNMDYEWREKVFEQAKEMDIEQKQNMFDCGRQYQLTGEGTFKEVYEEIYGDK
jgi:hypothetical protein